MKKKDVSVCIVENYPLSRFDLVFELKQKFNVLGSFACAEDCIDMLKLVPVDIVIMDLNLPGMNGIEATKFIKSHYPKTKVVAYSNHDDQNIVMSLIRNGASAYLTKETNLKLSLVLDLINSGVLLLDSNVADSMQNSVFRSCSHCSVQLTERETEVLHKMAEGLLNPEIAEEFVISRNTVKAHVCNIMKKLSVQNRTQAIVKAIKIGLL